jgi:NAD(P)-dependent dehydrogenase (short-subunit alcohol dehydrogenase family)
MTGRMQGKAAFVTGAASGIGRASAELMAREGATVALADIDAAGVQAAARDIGQAALAVPLDVTDPVAWKAALATAHQRFGALHALVHSAGISFMKPLEDITLEDWRRVHAINLDALFYGTQAALPLLRASGGGSVVIVSSSSGLRGKPDLTAYCSSKGGARLFAKAVAMEQARDGGLIRCNSVHPGPVDTPMVRKSFPTPEAWARINTRVPIGHVGQPMDIAYMVLYLASDESRYVTGAEFSADGGLTA